MASVILTVSDFLASQHEVEELLLAGTIAFFLEKRTGNLMNVI